MDERPGPADAAPAVPWTRLLGARGCVGVDVRLRLDWSAEASQNWDIQIAIIDTVGVGGFGSNIHTWSMLGLGAITLLVMAGLIAPPLAGVAGSGS